MAIRDINKRTRKIEGYKPGNNIILAVKTYKKVPRVEGPRESFDFFVREEGSVYDALEKFLGEWPSFKTKKSIVLGWLVEEGLISKRDYVEYLKNIGYTFEEITKQTQLQDVQLEEIEKWYFNNRVIDEGIKNEDEESR